MKRKKASPKSSPKERTLNSKFCSIPFFLLLFFFAINSLPMGKGRGWALLAQPSIQWKKSFGGSGNDFARFSQNTNDGGYIIVGYSNSSNGDVTNNYGGFDMWAVKIDSLGTIQWQKSIGGTGLDAAYNAVQTPDNGYIISGYSNSNDTNITGNHGMYDVLVAKLDSAGNMKWKKVYGGSADDGNIESGVLPVNDGGYIITTNTFSNDGDVSGNHGSGDFWIFKIDSLGSLKWQKCLGGSGDEDSHTIIFTSDSCFVLAGHTSSNDGDVGITKGGEDEWIVKIDSVGNIKWSKTFGGSSNDVAYYLTQANDGGYGVVGFTTSNDGDVSGNHGGADYWLIKLDSLGNMKWQKTLGGTGGDYGTRILPSLDNGFVLAGYSDSNDGDVTGNHGNMDYWILKTDSVGNIQWNNSFGGSGNDRLYCLSTACNGYLISGFSNSTNGDIDSAKGAMDMWTAKLCFNPVANFSFSNIGGYTYSFSDSSLNANYLYWNFGDDTIYYSGQNPVHTYPGPGLYLVCQIAINCCGSDTLCDTLLISPFPNAISNTIGENYFYVYPAIFSEGVNIISSSDEEAEVSVYDLLSRKVFQEKLVLSRGGKHLSLNRLSRGVHILTISSDKNTFTTKIIKE